MKYPVTVDISEVDGLQTALDNKSPIGHNHVIGDVSGLQSAIDGKSPIGHSHVIGDVSGLQSALDSKATSTHAHDNRVLAPDGYYYHGYGTLNGTAFGSNITLALLEINSPIAISSSIGLHCMGNQVGFFTFGLYRIDSWSNAARVWISPSLTPVDATWIDTVCNLTLNAGLYWLATIASVQTNLWAASTVFPRLGKMGVSNTPATGYVLNGQPYANSLPENINITAPVGGSTWAITNQRIPIIRYK